MLTRVQARGVADLVPASGAFELTLNSFSSFSQEVKSADFFRSCLNKGKWRAAGDGLADRRCQLHVHPFLCSLLGCDHWVTGTHVSLFHVKRVSTASPKASRVDFTLLKGEIKISFEPSQKCPPKGQSKALSSNFSFQLEIRTCPSLNAQRDEGQK